MFASQYQKIQNYDWETKKPFRRSLKGMLYKVLNLKTGVEVIIKEYPITKYSKDTRLSIDNSIAALDKVKGDFIVKHIKTFFFPELAYVVLELCNTNLKDYIKEHKHNISERDIARVVSNIANGMKSIHDNGCIHGNLNPYSILEKGGIWKLINFTLDKGLKNLVKDDQITEDKIRYIAPEVLLKDQPPTQRSDVWSLGVIMYEMVTGDPPFFRLDNQAYKKRLTVKRISLSEDLLLQPELRSLMLGCLNETPDKRLTWAQVMNHPFMAKATRQMSSVVKQEGMDLMEILRNFQQAIMEHIGSANEIKEFCDGKSSQFGITLKANKLITFDEFSQICGWILPTLTPTEIRMIFKWTDTSGDGYITQSQFSKLLYESEFVDVVKDFLDDIAYSIKERNIDPQKVFQNYDRDNSATLEETEIRQIASALIPKFPSKNLNIVCKHIAKRFNGKLPIKVLFEEYKSRNSDQLPENKGTKLKAELEHFRKQLKEYEVTSAQMVRTFDANNNNKIDFDEFKKIVYSVDGFLREEELKAMFNEVDADHSGTISVQEFKRFCGQK